MFFLNHYVTQSSLQLFSRLIFQDFHRKKNAPKRKMGKHNKSIQHLKSNNKFNPETYYRSRRHVEKPPQGAESDLQHAHPEQLHPDLHGLRGEDDRKHAGTLPAGQTAQHPGVYVTLHAGDDLPDVARREGAGTRRNATVYRGA